MEYEWDEKKRQSNIDKHGWDFAEAHKAFEQAPMVEEYQERRGEERWTGIGRIDGETVFLVFRETEETRHIISMRDATAEERDFYDRELGCEFGREDSLTKIFEQIRMEREEREIMVGDELPLEFPKREEEERGRNDDRER